MKKIFDHYFYLSTVSVLITIFTFRSIAASTDYIYCLLVGFAVLTIYNFHPVFFKVDQSTTYKLNYSFGLPILILLSLVGIAAFKLTLPSLMLLFMAFILCIGYFMKFYRWNLRSHYLTKPLTIGMVFGICTAAIPYIQSGYLVSESLFLSIGRILFITTLALIFDIGDVTQDKLEKNITIPSRWGMAKAKLFGATLLTLGFAIELWGAWNFLIDINGIVAIGFTYGITFLAVIFANPNRSWWYYEVFTDGIIGLPLIFLWIL